MNRAALDFLYYRATHDWTGISRPRETLRAFRGFEVRKAGTCYQARILGADMAFTMYHLSNVVNELASWETDYLPMPVEGKVVLSVGDGCGETSLFYLRHGAKKVIAVEKEPEPFRLLCRNIEKNRLNAVPVNESFSAKHLDMEFDFMKVDVEGGEEILLDVDRGKLKPCVVEAHRFGDRGLPEKLQARFGMKRISAIGRRAVLLTNVQSAVAAPPPPSH